MQFYFKSLISTTFNYRKQKLKRMLQIAIQNFIAVSVLTKVVYYFMHFNFRQIISSSLIAIIS